MSEITKNKEFKKTLEEIKKVSGLLWQKGWAEANAGNFSVNVTGYFGKTELKIPGNGIKTGRIYKHLKENFILLSSTGSRMRDISENPIPLLCLLYFDKTGNCFHRIPLEGSDNNKPTSEIFSHLEIHNTLRKNNSKDKVILHTHPAEVISLTHIKKYKNEYNINNLLYSIQPETAILFPEGIGFVPYFKTGSEKLAIETKKKFLKNKIVIWEKHGCVSTGGNFYEAFDRIDVFVKSLNIFFLVCSSGNKPDGLNVKQIKELKKLNHR